MSNIILDAFYSLGRKINKASGEMTNETEQGVVSEKLPELKLDMENKELAELTSNWENSWNKSEVKSMWITTSLSASSASCHSSFCVQEDFLYPSSFSQTL